MLKKKKIILAFMWLAILGGALYSTNYAVKKHERSVQTMKIKEEALTKAKEEKLAKKEEEAKANEEAKAKALIEKKSQIKTDEDKKSSIGSSQKVVVIDPGHGSVTSSKKEQQDPGSSTMKVIEPGGAQGVNTRTPEYVVNMAVAVKLKSVLQEKGYTVKMTKTQNNIVMGSKARAEFGNDNQADLVIRIHADGDDNSSVKGASMLVPADTKNTNAIYKTSKKYGEIVFSSLINKVGMKDRGVVERNDMTGFNWSKVPVILVEMGFQSNASEDKLLASDSYQDKIGRALAEGIDQALK
ncbi:N-acetylmuramoyl-L-alanine amidase [Clostridium sp. CM028]|uniref:N-acetylmuramoyl-L-alanine amidase family protein n=1 Tax=Clostridium sp. CM028 TaxID=2851575 RepID=UPI001C6F0779|nr:N-acetylmuramoyl-L-alanine amidase [Clostridium sp. CM028]MBW9149271.1 N-acetylmuramoyl-L-alanine amidase [Clostridium sp. CM028]WLC61136.1 N-acetylmuramoyl-L-alanine amidase [Clostridium sp. CM028]